MIESHPLECSVDALVSCPDLGGGTDDSVTIIAPDPDDAATLSASLRAEFNSLSDDYWVDPEGDANLQLSYWRDDKPEDHCGQMPMEAKVFHCRA